MSYPALIRERSMRRFFVFVTLGLVVALTAGCNQKPVPSPPHPSVKIKATEAYEKYFGPAPTSDKGSCFAFVIFFPSAKEPGKVVPFPFFTFDEASLKKVAIERLLSGMDVGSYRGEFLSLPQGVRFVSLNESQGAVTVTLSKEFEGKNVGVAASAIASTLRQFKETSAVRIMVEGRRPPLGASSDGSVILAPGPPRLLSVSAMKDNGAKDVEEVNAFFDRPVEIKELKLLSEDGQPFSGDLYQSVFDMAAVLKPKDPAQFRERLPIKVRWKVVDKLGRQAEGYGVWPLEVKEH